MSVASKVGGGAIVLAGLAAVAVSILPGPLSVVSGVGQKALLGAGIGTATLGTPIGALEFTKGREVMEVTGPADIEIQLFGKCIAQADRKSHFWSRMAGVPSADESVPLNSDNDETVTVVLFNYEWSDDDFGELETYK